jgi:hypothetical protein
MQARSTQLLIGMAAVLLTAHLFVLSAVFSQAHAREEPVSPVLRARLIELVDERGVTRANLKTEADGTVVFRMMDSKGTIRVKVGASDDGTGVVLLDANTEPGIHLLASGKETKIVVAEKGKEPRVLRP